MTDVLRNSFCRAGIPTWKQQHKLLAPPPVRLTLLTNSLDKKPGNTYKHGVSHLVPQCIVDPLEVVDVHEDERHISTCGLCNIQSVGKVNLKTPFVTDTQHRIKSPSKYLVSSLLQLSDYPFNVRRGVLDLHVLSEDDLIPKKYIIAIVLKFFLLNIS